LEGKEKREDIYSALCSNFHQGKGQESVMDRLGLVFHQEWIEMGKKKSFYEIFMTQLEYSFYNIFMII
jgi:hypothetical protein